MSDVTATRREKGSNCQEFDHLDSLRLWRWHIENNVSQSALVPLLQLIVQVISVAGAHEINATLSLKSFPTPYLNYESGLVWMTQVISKRWFAATNATESIPMMAACATDLTIVTEITNSTMLWSSSQTGPRHTLQ